MNRMKVRTIVNKARQTGTSIRSRFAKQTQEHESDLATTLTKIEQQEREQQQLIDQETQQKLEEGTRSYQKLLTQHHKGA